MAVFALGRWTAPGAPTPIPPSAPAGEGRPPIQQSTNPPIHQVARPSPDGEGPPPQYTVHQWTSANGLPASTIQCLLQTRDGYLWIGTRTGLVRFNGKEFRTTPGMNCRSLAEDSDGILWIGCSDGLVCWDGIDFQSYRRMEPAVPYVPCEVLSLCSRREGGVWLVWAGELWRARNEKLWKVADLHGLSANSLCESRAGRLYLAGSEGVGVLEPASPPGLSKVNVFSPAHGSKCVAESPDGVLWLGGAGDWDRVYRLRDDQIWEYPEPVSFLFSVAFDPRGTVWLGTERGLWEARENHLVRPQGLDGESFWVINCLLTDRDGNLWIGTEHHGLYCLYRKPFYTYTTGDGLASDDVWSITQAHDGSLWVATKAGASRMDRGHFTSFRARGHEYDAIWNDLRVITEDPSGTIWTRMKTGVLFVSGGELLTPEDGSWQRFLLSSAYGKGNGTSWFVGSVDQIRAFEHGTWKGQTIPLPGGERPSLLGVLQDASGDLWVGSSEHGLFHLQKDKTTRVTQDDGLTSDMVAPVLADSDGTLWLASNKGLNRLKDGHITRYIPADGLAEDIVMNVLEDGSGGFWLNGHRGIHRVSRRQLEDFARGKLRLLDCATYGLEDGLLSVEGNGGFYPNSCKTRDGRLWFPTTKGLAVVDPKLSELHALPPPVLVESLRADGQVVYDNGPGSLAGMPVVNLAATQTVYEGLRASRAAHDGRELRLPPGRADSLLFSLTANTLLRTEQVRFRYRLEGRDPHWMDLGTQPSVLIKNLPPGHYRFRATACNSHGVWNLAGAEFAFYVAPFFYQTWTFYGLCAGALLFGIAAFEAYRHSVQRRILGLEKDAALAGERERIARDLHDDLGASLSRIALLSEVARKDLEADSRAAPGIGRISAIAREVVDSISELVWATNSKYDNLESLAAYFREYAARFFEPAAIECRLNFPSKLPACILTAEFRRELFLVFKESLHNVIRHARAGRVEISLSVEPGWLEIAVQDNGQGMVSQDTPGFHHGLGNMRERVAHLHGAFDLQSAPGQGTRISVRVPLPGA